MIVADIAGQCREAEVGVEWKSQVVKLETAFPVIPFGVVDLQLSVDVLDVNEFTLGSDLGVAVVDRATSNLLASAVVVVLVGFNTIAVHDGNARERVRVPRVGISVKEDAETGKVVDRSEDRTRLGTILSEPDSHTITSNVRGVTFDLELEYDFKVLCSEG